MKQETSNSKLIKANASKIFEALSNPDSIVKWQVPGEMTGKIHYFDFRVGGGYSMSLFYPGNGNDGKTNKNEDRFTSKFTDINLNKKIVESIIFDSDNESFTQEMIMEITLESKNEETLVTFSFKNIPKGIDPKDNEAGTKSSLEKLAKLVE